MAAGEIIVVQDSDDISEGRRLRVISDYFAAHEDVDIFFSSAVYTDRDLKPVRRHPANMSFVACLEAHQMIQHPTMAYHGVSRSGPHRPQTSIRFKATSRDKVSGGDGGR